MPKYIKGTENLTVSESSRIRWLLQGGYTLEEAKKEIARQDKKLRKSIGVK